jgi:hypothetical protein
VVLYAMCSMCMDRNKHTGKITELEDFSRATRSSVEDQSVLLGLHHKRMYGGNDDQTISTVENDSHVHKCE